MRCRQPMMLALLVAAVTLVDVRAQAPKPVLIPPVNPAIARLEQTASGLDGPGIALASSNNASGVLFAASAEGGLRTWSRDPARGWQIADAMPHLLKGHTGPVLAVATGGKTVASGGADGKTLLWAVPGDKVLQTLTPGGMVRCLAVSPDGKLLASGSDSGGVQLWDPATARMTRKLDGPTDWTLALAFSADGKFVAAGGQDGRLRVWDAATGKKFLDVLAQPAPAPKAPAPTVNVVSAIAFSPDGKLIALGGSDPRIHLFQTTDGKLLRSLTSHTGTITALAFHPAGAVLLSASKDRAIRLWNPLNSQMLKALEGHTAWVEGLALLDNGTHVASISADRTVRIWRLADPPKPQPKPKPKK